VKPVLEIDGLAFDDLDGFYREVYRTLAPGAPWAGRNLDAFHDVLRGGFGGLNSERSRRCLGQEETVRYLERTLTRCHLDNAPGIRAELEAMERGRGPTLFDRVLEIIREHGHDGRESEDGVELDLR
jgi:hypothetical protein